MVVSRYMCLSGGAPCREPAPRSNRPECLLRKVPLNGVMIFGRSRFYSQLNLRHRSKLSSAFRFFTQPLFQCSEFASESGEIYRVLAFVYLLREIFGFRVRPLGSYRRAIVAVVTT